MTNHQSMSPLWQRLFTVNWQRQVLPGTIVIGLIILARLMGLWQELEWKTFDAFLRLRPAQPQDQRILIVGINEADIQRAGTYPIPDQDLASLIETLNGYGPRAIGLDIFRDLPVEPGYAAFKDTLERLPNVYGIEIITGDAVLPPAMLPPERVGFADLPLDQDGFVRRAYLGGLPALNNPDPDRFRFSFGLQLAKAYLAEGGISLDSGRRNPDNMRLGTTEFDQLHPNTGGYVRASGGLQILINPRSGREPFQQVSMTDVLQGDLDPSLIRDRVVLIGITSLSAKDLVNSAAVNTSNPGLFYGVEMQAHITSQILSAVLDDRPLLRSWPDAYEYLWITFWGGVGIFLVHFLPRPAQYMIAVGLLGMSVAGFSFLVLWLDGLWIPVVPTLMGLAINGWVLSGFYLYDQTLRSRIDERQRVIERTYDAIHNGPLQTLALLLRKKSDLPLSVRQPLENLNWELREVYRRLQEESLPLEDQLQLGGQRVLDLRHPLHEVLYEVYIETLKRDFPGFDTVKFQVVKFEQMQLGKLSSDHKRSLCRFLEEALCNVGKHADSPKRLIVTCMATETLNMIRVEDNGKIDSAPLKQPKGGRGTQQAQALARRLGGQFDRKFGKTGTFCQLQWPLHPPRWR